MSISIVQELKDIDQHAKFLGDFQQSVTREKKIAQQNEKETNCSFKCLVFSMFTMLQYCQKTLSRFFATISTAYVFVHPPVGPLSDTLWLTLNTGAKRQWSEKIKFSDNNEAL
ncbi:hypothetical protein PV325_001900 [Microctonus aethiopoides]|uniref:Uncharacterized protein n=1 Tax=Microctonus aethiopoides TaxID=144406 RepID=A0AA39FVF9_9HYME|nr:hypothetical protein PV325_001900 [Microctonus aethiopoides]KAK0098531.1 hypothetical protein PV326_007209 [Microctonus aethiopoides]KAK0176595.1 hypothetical protein PV328_000714 [Microctonus aethiopoides]